MKKLRIVFMGTPDFAVAPLRALYEAGHEIIAVYTQPPRPKGRGQDVQKSPVQMFAEKKSIPVFHPKTLKNEEAQTEFAALQADVAVVAAYGLLLPKAVLQAPKYGCINIHASLLPRWRGASPIQRSIWAGDHESGVTLMQMDEGLDTGPMIAMEKIPLTSETTASSLHDALAILGAEMIVKAAGDLAAHEKLHATPQDNAGATYASLLKKEDGIIDWKKSAVDIDRQIRALNPWPGTWANFEGKRMKILSAIPSPQPSPGGRGDPGVVLDKTGNILCGENTSLQITKLQPEGKKPMDFASALNGGYVKIGERFS
ncbi:MAG: methionyl-tRNA formyltransferase [Alphaproteobacteria bacterium]